MFAEVQGNAYVGDSLSYGPLNKPFLVYVNAARHVPITLANGATDVDVIFYGWIEHQTLDTASTLELPGPREGRVWPLNPLTDEEVAAGETGIYWPLWEPNGVELQIYSYALIIRAYFDAKFSWVYMVLWASGTASSQESAAPTPVGPAMGYGSGPGSYGPAPGTTTDTFGPNKVVELVGPNTVFSLGRPTPYNPSNPAGVQTTGVPAPPILIQQTTGIILNSRTNLEVIGSNPLSTSFTFESSGPGKLDRIQGGRPDRPIRRIDFIPVDLNFGLRQVPVSNLTMNTSTGVLEVIPQTFSDGVPNSTRRVIPPGKFIIRTTVPGTNPLNGRPTTGTGTTQTVLTISQNPTLQSNGNPQPPEFTFDEGTTLTVPSVVKQPTINTATVTGTNNDYIPTHYNGIVPVQTPTGAATITGITVPPFLSPGQTVNFTIVNAGPDSLTLSNLSGSSSDGNRLLSPTGADVIIPADGSQSLFYDYQIDSGAGGWRLASGTALSSSSSGPTWTKLTFTYLDFSDPSQGVAFTVYNQSPLQMVHAAAIRHTQSFLGGAIVDYSVALVGGNGDLVSGGSFNVFQAPGNTVFAASVGGIPGVPNLQSVGGGTLPIVLNVNSSGAALDQATQGIVDVYLLLSTLP